MLSVSAVLLAGSLFASTFSQSLPSANKTTTVIPRAWIIQLNTHAEISTSSLADRDIDAHAAFHKRAEHIDYTIRAEFKDPSLFYGLSIKTSQNYTADEIQKLVLDIPDVLAIWPVEKISLPSLPVSFSSARWNASEADSQSGALGLTASRRSSDPHRPMKITGKLEISSTLEMTQVDKLHALGIKGRGIKIGILDTGVDYRHPSLGGRFGPGHKIAGGHAFVGDLSDLDENGLPDDGPDPLCTCFGGGHGTHVSGIVGMEDPDDSGFGLVGVAPEASIYMYRIFNCYDFTATDIVLRGLAKAAEDGVDIISMSFGQPTFASSRDPFALMTSALAAKGVALIAAAGNDGKSGVGYISSPGMGQDVISVGSIANTKFPLTYKGVDNHGAEFVYAAVWPIQSTEEFDVFLLTPESPLGCSYQGLSDAQSKINVNTTLLVLYGDKCRTGYWAYFAFKYLMLLNEVNSTNPFASDYYLEPLGDYGVQQFLDVDGRHAERLLHNWNSSGGYEKYKMTFGDLNATTVKQSITGGLMSNYSSFGLPWDSLAMKSQLSAPGGNILSTWPLGDFGGYTIISGTSMATPFVAACYALVKSQFPNLSVPEIRAKLQSTSTPVDYLPDKSILSTAIQQGAGLVNPYKAIQFESSVFPAELSLGDTDSFSNHASNITITNRSDRSKTYLIEHSGAGYVEYFPYTGLLQPEDRLKFGEPQYAKYASAAFSQSSVLIPAGKAATIQIQITPPADTDSTRNPIFSGFITVTNNNDKFVVPYAGLPYSRHDVNYFGNCTSSPPCFKTFVEEAIIDHGIFDRYNMSVNTGLQTYNASLYESSKVNLNIIYFTKRMRVDILPANTTFVPDIYGFDPAQKFEYQASDSPLSSTFLGEKTYGQIVYYNITDALPDQRLFSWDDLQIETDQGEVRQAGLGDYRMLVSVLRWGADPLIRESWQTFLTPVLRYVR